MFWINLPSENTRKRANISSFPSVAFQIEADLQSLEMCFKIYIFLFGFKLL